MAGCIICGYALEVANGAQQDTTSGSCVGLVRVDCDDFVVGADGQYGRLFDLMRARVGTVFRRLEPLD